MIHVPYYLACVHSTPDSKFKVMGRNFLKYMGISLTNFLLFLSLLFPLNVNHDSFKGKKVQFTDQKIRWLLVLSNIYATQLLSSESELEICCVTLPLYYGSSFRRFVEMLHATF